jgi:hypothetical protein
MIGLRSLADGLQPLQAWFADHRKHARLIAIQSAT